MSDHAVSGLAQLGVHVLLTRWLEPSEYGAFVVGHATFLGGMAVHAAFLAEPALIFARREYADRGAPYFASLLRLHVKLSGGITLGLVAVAALLGTAGAASPAEAVFAFALATPILLLLTLVRRISYARSAPLQATSGSLIHAVLLIGGIPVLHGFGWLAAPSAVAVMAIGSLAGAGWIAWQSGLRWRLSDASVVRDVHGLHWRYGRWALPSALVSWIPWNVHFVLLAPVLGLQEIAGLRALYNALLPIHHVMMALSAVSLPLLAEQRARGQGARFRSTLRRLALLYAAAGGAYALAMLFLGEPLLRLVYGGNYESVYHLAPWVAAIQLPFAGIMLVALRHQAAAQSRHVLRTYLPYAVLALALGALGGIRFGTEGVVGGILCAAMLGLWAARRGLDWRRGARMSRPIFGARPLRTGVGGDRWAA